MWWREVNYWGAAVGRQAGWHGGGEGQEAEGGGTSTAHPLSRQACCVLTLLCRVRLLATTVVLGSALRLCSSLPFLSLLFPLVVFHSYSHILPLLICINSPHSSPPLPALPPLHPPLPVHTPHPRPHHPVARIMTLLTTQTHGGSGYGPAKSSQSPTSITSLAPLSR